MLTLKNKILMTATTLGLLSAGGMATTANAQDSYMPPQGQQQQQINVTETELQEFAKAQDAISQLQEQFQGQAANITSQAEMTALQQQVNEQMVQAIQKTDLSIDQYNLIATAVQTDPNLQKKYMDMVQ